LFRNILKRKCNWTGYLLLPILLTCGFFFLMPEPVHAMHIAEGILPFNWAAIWYVIALAFLIPGIVIVSKNIKKNKSLLPLYGLAGAVVFIISALPIPVPVAGSCSHPCGTPMAAILVGPFASIVLGALALLLQALFMSHGGFSTWGANIMSMAVVGSFVGFGVFILARKFKTPIFVAGLLAGLLGDWATYATTSFELASALHGTGSMWDMFGAICVSFAPTQLPLGIFEGLITGGVVSLISQRRPDVLSRIMKDFGKKESNSTEVSN
jgi:cobalt/nickel transport system permease protein